MNLKRTLLLGAGSGAVIVWIATASTFVPRASPPLRASGPRAVEVSGAKLAEEIAHLHERLRPSAVPLENRNLFSYNTVRQAPSRAKSLEPVVALPSVPMPTPPALKLVGIAEDGPADAVIRTAVISGLGDLFLVKEGEALSSRYRVTAVAADGVDLIDTSDQTSHHLTLR